MEISCTGITKKITRNIGILSKLRHFATLKPTYPNLSYNNSSISHLAIWCFNMGKH